jgi:hypothetical protein
MRHGALTFKGGELKNWEYAILSMLEEQQMVSVTYLASEDSQIEVIEPKGRPTGDVLTSTLATLGRQGWELIQISTGLSMFWLKREIEY